MSKLDRRYINFCKKYPHATLPTKGEDEAIAWDMYSFDETVLWPEKGERVKTGIIVVPPLGWYCQLFLRSSSFKHLPDVILTNHVGLIDPNYSGPEDTIKVSLKNLGADSLYIPAGQRIAQLTLAPIPRFDSKEIPYDWSLKHG